MDLYHYVQCLHHTARNHNGLWTGEQKQNVNLNQTPTANSDTVCAEAGIDERCGGRMLVAATKHDMTKWST